MKYDIIGDIHGHADELETLLRNLGYRKDAKEVYVPPEPDRQAVFLGDFIDRGPGQFRVIDIVRNMMEAGHAKAIMGNHEFNAIMYHTHVPDGANMRPLRAHSHKNTDQHKAFLDAMKADSAQGRRNIEWMKSLPVYLKLEGIRVVHAFWDDEAIQLLKSQGVMDENNRFKPDQYPALEDWHAPLGNAAELLTKGMEVELPPGVHFTDPGGVQRHAARVKWWADLNDPKLSLDKLLLDVPPGAVPHTPLPDDIREKLRAAQEGHKEMVFFGHYWQEGETPQRESSNAICLDQSVARDGHLAAATVTVDYGAVRDIEFSSVKSIPHVQALDRKAR